MIESRKFIRLKAPLAIEYTMIKKHKRQKKMISSMLNICVGGLSLEVREVVRQGDLMKIQIQVPHWVEPVRVVGDVIWCSPASGNKENPAHEAGVRFRDINPVELHKILDYVYSVAIG